MSKRSPQSGKQARPTSEERLQFCLETGHIGTWDLDLTDYTALHSPEHDRIFGYTKPLPHWSMDRFLKHALPEYRAPVAALARKAIKTQTGFSYECRIRRKDGAIRWIWFTGKYYKDSTRRPRVAGIVQDITSRKQAEESMRSDEKFKTNLLDSLPSEVAVINAKGEIVAVNEPWRRFARANGHLPMRRIGIGANYLEVCRKASRAGAPFAAEATKGIQAVLSGRRKEFQLEYPCDAPSKKRWFNLHAVAAANPVGGAVIAHHDTTALKQAEQALRELNATLEQRVAERTAALRESEHRYRAVIEHQTEVITRFLPDGTLTFVNEVFCRFFGKKAAKLVGQKWHPRAASADVPHIEAQLRKLSAKNPVVVIENRVYDGKGKLHWMQFVNRGFFDRSGRLIETQAVGRDITVRKHAEEALVASEARFRSIFNSNVVALALWDVHGKLHEANDQFLKIIGYTRAKFQAGKVRWDEATPRELRSRDAQAVKELVAGREVEPYEKKFIRPDGTRVPVMVGGTMLPGTSELGVVFAVDITEQKRLQAEVQNVSEMERQRLGYDLHDGLGQHLAAMSMMSGTLHDTLQAKQLPEAKQAAKLGAVAQEAVTIARDLSRALYPASLQITGMATALTELATLVERMFSIHCRFRTTNVQRLTDPHLERQLFRIAQEAAFNAAKHSRGRHIWITLRQAKRSLTLTIQDDGIGLSAAKLATADSGLNIMKYRADLIGSSFTVNARRGHGTTITCKLRNHWT